MGQKRGRGGHNKLKFGEEEQLRWSPLNGEELNGRGVEHGTAKLWVLACGCYVFKCRHAVRKSYLEHPVQHRWGGRDPWELACFRCPRHGPFRSVHQRQASIPEIRAHGMLCRLAAGWGARVTVVWQPHLVKRRQSYDFWLWPTKLVVEVDGWQHGVVGMHGADPTGQLLYDSQKSWDACAEGYHVVRLHVADVWAWEKTVNDAWHAAITGCPPQVHLSTPYLCDAWARLGLM